MMESWRARASNDQRWVWLYPGPAFSSPPTLRGPRLASDGGEGGPQQFRALAAEGELEAGLVRMRMRTGKTVGSSRGRTRAEDASGFPPSQPAQSQ